jgi:hypothetical protein
MKSYKVKNESGQQFEVDEDKLHDAEKDGYLPIVSNGKEEHRVASADLPKAMADGYKPLLSAPEVSELESLGRGAFQGATFGFSDEIVGGLESLFTDKTYEQARDESRANNAAAQEANPASYLTGDIGASVATSFVPGLGFLNAAKGAKLATVAGKAALQGGIAGAGYSDEKDAAGILKDTATGVALGAGTGAAFHGVGKALKSDKGKVIADYLSDKFHKVTDSASDLVTSSPNGTAKAVRELGFAERNKLRDLSAEEVENRILKSKDSLEDIFAKSSPEITNKYSSLEQEALENVYKQDHELASKMENNLLAGLDVTDELDSLKGKLTQDHTALGKFGNELGDTLKKIEEHKTFYSPTTKRAIENVKRTLDDGGPLEYGLKKAKADTSDTLEGVTGLKRRILNSRREIDDLLKNKDIEKLRQHDVDVLMSTREKMNNFLQREMAGAKELAGADDMWARWAKAKEEVLEPIKSVEKQKVSADKLENFMKRNTYKRDDWLKGTGEHFDWLKQQVSENPELVMSIEKTMKDLGTLSQDLQNKQFLDTLNLIGGGPTGKAISKLIHVGSALGGGFVNPMIWVADIASMPITDPEKWFRVKDIMLKAADKAGNSNAVSALIKGVESSGDTLAKTSPRLVTQMYILNKKEPDQEE